MAFAQLTYRESLRDIETCLRAMRPKLYHAGIRGRVARSTLAEANEKRPWQMYADFAPVVTGRARTWSKSPTPSIPQPSISAFRSSPAHFRQRKGAIKMHTLMDLRGGIPCFVRITDGKMHPDSNNLYLCFDP